MSSGAVRLKEEFRVESPRRSLEPGAWSLEQEHGHLRSGRRRSGQTGRSAKLSSLRR